MSAPRQPAAPTHIPVLLDEVIAALAPAAGETFVDGTFGGGGYTSAILASGADVIAIDRDPRAVAAGAPLVDASAGRLKLVNGRFSELDQIVVEAGAGRVDGVTLDIGFSSTQIDDPERGLAFSLDGPLDMRMGDAGETAAE